MSQCEMRSAKWGVSELSQESNVVPIEFANIGNAMPPHAESLNPQAERKAGIDLGIVADGSQDVRIDHPSAAELDPAVVPMHVGLDARLRKRKERRTEANMHIFAQVARREHAEHALQISHCH